MMRRSRGFTLAEMLLVLALLGIAILMVTLGLGQLRARNELRSVADQLLRALNDAKAMATARGVQIGVFFAPDQGVLVCYSAADLSNPGILRRYEVRPVVSVWSAVTTWPSYSLPNFTNGYSVICDPWGRLLDPNTRDTILHPVDMGLRHKVSVSGGGGGVEIAYRVRVFPVWSPTLYRERL